MPYITPSAPERYYTVKELAAATGMSIPYWRAQILRKAIRVDRFGRSVRITERSLQEFLAKQREAA